MDTRACLVLLVVVVHCVCVAYSSESADQFEGHMLETKLREEIERELADVHQLERQLLGHMELIKEKKRQLEIKKRTPVQCLVNIVSCWKK